MDLEAQLRPTVGKLNSDMSEIITQLCEPDPTRRGDPQTIGTVTPQHSLERYVARLDLLARKAELDLI